MMSKKALLSILPAALLACGGPFSNPTEVARRYWESMADGDVETAREYVTPSTARTVRLPEQDFTVDQIQLVVAEVAEDRGVVQTSVDVMAENMDLHLEFETVLAKVDGRWLVDAETTNANLGASAIQSLVGTSLSGLGDMLGEAFGDAMRGMAEGLQQGMGSMGEAVVEGGPADTPRPDPPAPNVKQ